MLDASILMYINSYQLMENCPKLTSLVSKYLKVDCRESDLKAEERAIIRLQNADTERRETLFKIPSLVITPTERLINSLYFSTMIIKAMQLVGSCRPYANRHLIQLQSE